MSSKQNDRHIIWSNINLDFEDWRADLEEQYPDLSEDELIQKMYEINSDYLGDERMKERHAMPPTEPPTNQDLWVTHREVTSTILSVLKAQTIRKSTCLNVRLTLFPMRP